MICVGRREILGKMVQHRKQMRVTQAGVYCHAPTIPGMLCPCHIGCKSLDAEDDDSVIWYFLPMRTHFILRSLSYL